MLTAPLCRGRTEAGCRSRIGVPGSEPSEPPLWRLLLTSAVSGCQSAGKDAADQAAKLQMTCAREVKPVDLPAGFPAAAKLPDG